jgi:Zn-dependent protease
MPMDPLFILSVVVGMLVACITHEWAHAKAAYSLGDPTGKYEGRLSLNPKVHLDPVGSIVLVSSTLVSQGAVPLGWAKPVPHNADNFRDPFFDIALVAAAGPSINFILAVLFACAYRFGLPGEVFWFTLVRMNLGFGLFNLFPFPPLDGWKMLQALMPKNTARSMRGFERSLGNYAGPLVLVLGYFVFGPYVIVPIFVTVMKLLLGLG